MVGEVINNKRENNQYISISMEALQKPPCQAGWNKNVLFGFS